MFASELLRVEYELEVSTIFIVGSESAVLSEEVSGGPEMLVFKGRSSL